MSLDAGSRKPGRNEPCPCGSGKKFKRCHGGVKSKSDNSASADMDTAIQVTYHPTGETWGIGSPGMTIFGVVETRGDTKGPARNPSGYWTMTAVDLPRHLPVSDFQMPVEVDSGTHWVSVLERKRGDEKFSSLDTTRLPLFTRMEITTHSYITNHLEVLYEVLAYFDALQGLVDVDFEPLATVDYLSVIAVVLELPDRVPVAKTVYPLTGTHRLISPSQTVAMTDTLKGQLDALSLQMAGLAHDRASAKPDGPFSDLLLDLMESFAFYSRQHPNVLSQLDEELVRDLCLVLMKSRFGSAEGEAFNFSGRSDIKAVNPDDKFEFHILEFKKWKGEASWREAYSQAVRQHSTGQEAGIQIWMLSNNLDQNLVFEKMQRYCAQEDETVEGSTRISVESTSGERIFSADVQIRGRVIPMTVGLIDLYYKNPRRVTNEPSPRQ